MDYWWLPRLAVLSILLCNPIEVRPEVTRSGVGRGAPTIDQWLELAVVSNPRISPDGTRVVYQQRRTNWDANAYESDLWIAAADGSSPPRRLTRPSDSAVDAAWSPDGRWLAFRSDRPGSRAPGPEKTFQIYLMSASGGEPVQITRGNTSVTAFAWSPDGRALAFIAPNAETAQQRDQKAYYGEFRVVREDYTLSHLWLLHVGAELAGAKTPPVRLTGGSYTVTEFSFSPDGSHIAFAAQRTPAITENMTSDIYRVALHDRDVKKLNVQPGSRSPLWSPDGTRIAYIAPQRAMYLNTKIMSVPFEGGRPSTLNPAFDEDPKLLAWSPRGIYFSALQHTARRVFVLDPVRGASTPLSALGEIVEEVSISPDFAHMTFSAADPNQMAEILITRPDSWAPMQVTHMSEQLRSFSTTTQEVIRWRSKDGTEIEGVLQKPAGYEPGHRYPLLVVIHGGPDGIDLPYKQPDVDTEYPLERFLSRGALILRPNYRGSVGYGEKFRALNVRRLGIDDYADVMSGVDSLIAKGFVDKDRVGCMGWSQGGYICAFLTTFADRFKAASVGAGISDWSTYYYNTDVTQFTLQYLGGTPSQEARLYRESSPITYAAHAKTPTLIQSGSDDPRVPVANSFELRQALADTNVPVKLVLYTGFGHLVDKPKQQRAVMLENELWFGHYLWGDPLPATLPVP